MTDLRLVQLSGKTLTLPGSAATELAQKLRGPLLQPADAAYEHLTGKRALDPHRLVLYGESLGAAVAVDLAARRPVGGLIMESAFSSAVEVGREGRPSQGLDQSPALIRRLVETAIEKVQTVEYGRPVEPALDAVTWNDRKSDTAVGDSDETALRY